MYAAVDATEENMQPIRDAHVIRVWFFMLFMLVGSYLVMNLFVGVIIDNFNKVIQATSRRVDHAPHGCVRPKVSEASDTSRSCILVASPCW